MVHPGVLFSGGSRGEARGARPPLFLDQTKARRVEKNFLRPAPPLYLRVWMIAAPSCLKVWIQHCYLPPKLLQYSSLRSKRFQSSFCANVRAEAKKRFLLSPPPPPSFIFSLLLSQLSRRTSRGNVCYAG